MKAVSFNEYGPAEVLKFGEVPMPTVGPDEVLIRVRVAGINPADWRLCNGQFRRAFRLKLPFIPGSDVAGEVEAVGSRVTRFRKGDGVFALLGLKAGGGYAEYATAPEDAVAHIPAGGDCDAYGATPLAGLTAWQGLVRYGGIQSGQTVLIHGGSGGVGSYAVQIARSFGAHVTAVTSGGNAELVRGFGADEVIDYRTKDPFQGPKRFDLIFDTIATESFKRWAPALKKSGVLVTVNPIIGKVLPRFVTRMMGIDRLASFFVLPNAKDLTRLGELIEAKQVRPHVQATFSLEQAADAQILSEGGRVRGKLVLRNEGW